MKRFVSLILSVCFLFSINTVSYAANISSRKASNPVIQSMNDKYHVDFSGMSIDELNKFIDKMKDEDQTRASGNLLNNTQLSVCHGHSQVRDNAQSHHSAQAGRTPRACCIVANQVQLAVPGYCRIRPRWQGSQWQWQSHQRTGLPLGWCPYYSAKNVLFENYSGQKFDFVSFECPL